MHASLAQHMGTVSKCKALCHEGSGLITFPTAHAALCLVCAAGLAAGFDKHAEVIGPMMGLGFGFVEVGECSHPLIHRHLTGLLITHSGLVF